VLVAAGRGRRPRGRRTGGRLSGDRVRAGQPRDGDARPTLGGAAARRRQGTDGVGPLRRDRGHRGPARGAGRASCERGRRREGDRVGAEAWAWGGGGGPRREGRRTSGGAAATRRGA